MDIITNMPIKFIREFVSKGGTLTIDKDCDGEFYLDLNTGMKSHLFLYYGTVGNYTGYYARGRYDAFYEIETKYNLLYAIRECYCGRDFVSGTMRSFLEKGYDDEWEDFE